MACARYRPARDRLLEMTQLTPFRAAPGRPAVRRMKQKLALACTLVHEPKILCSTSRRPVSTRCRAVSSGSCSPSSSRSGLTIVMATPYLDEAERCARVALLHDGHCSPSTRPATLRQRFGGQMVEVVTDTPRPPLEALAALPGVEDVQAFGERAHVRVSGSGAERAASIRSGLEQRGIQVTSVRPVAAVARGRLHRSHYAEGGRTEVSPSMPTRRGTTARPDPDSGRIGARTASGRSGGANNSDAHPGGRHCQRIGEQPTHRGARGAVGGRHGKRGTARGGSSSCLVFERRLHAHQPRYTVLDRAAGRASGHLSRHSRQLSESSRRPVAHLHRRPG